MNEPEMGGLHSFFGHNKLKWSPTPFFSFLCEWKDKNEMGDVVRCEAMMVLEEELY